MKVEIKEIDPIIREITVTVPVEETEPLYRKALNKVKGKAAIPGFRPGKAPEKMVELQYESYITQEFYEMALEHFYFKAIDENELNPINEPENTKLEWEKGQDFIAAYRFEVHPEIELTNYSNLEVEWAPIPLEDDINNYLDDMRQKMAQFLEAEGPVVEKDLVEVEITYSKEDEEKKMNHTFFLFPEYMEKALVDTLVGKDIGETVTTDIDEHILHHEHEHEGECAHGKVSASIMINSIRRSHLPELDDEFAKDAEFDSLEDMKDKIGEELLDHNVKGNLDRKQDAILTKIFELNPFPLPKSFVDRITAMYMESQQGKDIPDWFKTYYKILAEKQAKRLYIMRKLRDLFEVTVTDEDKTAFIAKLAEEHKETVEEFTQKHPDMVEAEGLESDIIEDKVFNQLEKTITYVKPVPKVEEPVVEKKTKAKSKAKE